MKLKLMSMAAMALSALLCLTTTGAWAGKLEPLITIESTGDNASFTSGSKTFDDKVTVTFSGNVGNDNDNWGWYTYSTSEITLTVTAAEGYTITGVKFYTNDGSAFVDEAPFQAILVYDGGVVTKVNGTSIGTLGVTKIEVYGYAGTPATVAVTGVTLNQNEAAMTVGGETLTLTATVNPEGATDKSVTWSTTDGNVATVENGVVTAVAAGTATITVTTTDGAKTATCTVTVTAPEPAQPEWVLEGDEWDDATKTLTVNSNLPEDAYKGQTVIEHVIISSGVTSVGNSAFYDCSSLTSVTIGNSVTSIGDYAFDSCSGLTSITIPSSVTSIGSDAFYDCTSITDVYCYPNAANLTWDEEEDDFIRNPAKATACHVHADQLSAYESKFTGEVNVTFVGDLPASTPEPEEPEIVNHVQIGDLYYNLNADNQTAEVTYQEFMSETNYSSLTAVNIPESVEYNSVTYSVTSIGMGAFLGCTGLTSITIPSSVTSIGDGAFQSCEGLTSIEIPNSVTSIGGAAFYGCIGLTSVTIGNSVTSIGDAAFCYCTGLASFTINATTQPTLGSAAFEGTAEGLKIYVPAESVADYKAAENWADYEDKIEAIPAPEPSGPHGECGAQGNNVVWSLNTATGVLTISGTGAMADYESVEEQPWKDYRSTITSVVVEEGVTTIGTTAFDGCSGLTSVTIPNSVTSIGGGAFYGCTGLTSVAIPNSVTSIGVGAFEECTGLTSVTIPNSVTSIGNRAFSYCSGLTSIIIPNSVTIIGEDVFNGCSGLTSIEIPNSVTSIGWCAFFGCEGLTSITIPNSVEYIGEGAFFGCTNITDVYCYPSAADLTWNEEDCNDFKDDGSTECHVLANQLAAYQEKFTGVVNVTFVGDLPAPAPAWLLDGDEWDEATKTLTVNSDLPENAYKGQTVIEHVIISSGVTSVGNSAFDGCSGLTSIEIPNGVTSIGYATFAGCTGLTSITIPNSVTSIGDAAFYGCSGLTSITIPNSVTSIGNLAFRYCSNLETVTINAESLESYGTNAFQGTAEGLKIYVPAESVADYKAAENWAAYADKIVAIATPAPAEPVAQSYEAKVFDVPASWAGDETLLSAADMPEDFVQITFDEAAALAVPDGNGYLIFGFNGDKGQALIFDSGTFAGGFQEYFPKGNFIMLQTEENAKFCYPAAASAGYSVSLKEDTEDASNWQGKAGEGEYQALPLEGVAAGMAVTVKYSGTKKVKSVKAVKKAAPAPAAPAAKAAAEATAEDKGKLIGTDGNIYADVAAATAAGTTAAAKIIYIGTTGHATYSHGLALALNDETSKMAWQAAIDACSAKNTSTPVTNATWLLASEDQWEYMMGTNGAGGYEALRDGSNLQSDEYWSSTGYDSDNAGDYDFGYGDWFYASKTNAVYVRACLAF